MKTPAMRGILVILRHTKMSLARLLPFVFLACAFSTGLGLALFTPMSEVPDEPAHIARADGLVYGQILGHEVKLPWPAVGKGTDSVAGVMTNTSIMDAAMTAFSASLPDSSAAMPAQKKLNHISWSDKVEFTPTQMADYFPAFYLPAACGIELGYLVGFSPFHTLFLGRIFMLITFCIMGFTALRLARFGQPLFLVTLLLPMTLYLAASFNQDGQLIGATVLACAILTRAENNSPGLHSLGRVDSWDSGAA